MRSSARRVAQLFKLCGERTAADHRMAAVDHMNSVIQKRFAQTIPLDSRIVGGISRIEHVPVLDEEQRFNHYGRNFSVSLVNMLGTLKGVQDVSLGVDDAEAGLVFLPVNRIYAAMIKERRQFRPARLRVDAVTARLKMLQQLWKPCIAERPIVGPGLGVFDGLARPLLQLVGNIAVERAKEQRLQKRCLQFHNQSQHSQTRRKNYRKMSLTHSVLHNNSLKIRCTECASRSRLRVSNDQEAVLQTVHAAPAKLDAERDEPNGENYPKDSLWSDRRQVRAGKRAEQTADYQRGKNAQVIVAVVQLESASDNRNAEAKKQICAHDACR